MAILIDTGHLGRILNQSRNRTHLARQDAASALGITEDALRRYECGADLIPSPVLMEIMSQGFKRIRNAYLSQEYVHKQIAGTKRSVK